MKKTYEEKVKQALAKELGIKNSYAVPRIEKVVFNMGTGTDLSDKGTASKIKADVAIVTGQSPEVRQAKISVAGFGIRSGNPVGLRVTLRGERMYAFLQRLISVALPRLRDFRGISAKSFDKKGNYSLGLSEHTIFPEIDIAKTDKPRGFEVTLVMSSSDPHKSKRLLEMLGFPFEKEGQSG